VAILNPTSAMPRIHVVGQSVSVTCVVRTIERWFPVTRWPRVRDAFAVLSDEESVVIFDATHVREESLESLAKVRQARGRIVCLVPISDIGVRSFVELAKHLPRASPYAVPSPPDGLDALTLREILFEPDHGPVSDVLPPLLEIVSPRRPYLLGASVLFGRRRYRLSTFARLCGVAPRTVQVFAKHQGLPNPSRLQRWGLVFWVHWRMQRWGLTGKQAAAAAGFTLPATLNSITRVLTGLSPVALAREVGVGELVLLAANDMKAGDCSETFHNGQS